LAKARLGEIVSFMKSFISAHLLAPAVYRSGEPEILKAASVTNHKDLPELFGHETRTRAWRY
jgi:hypothetical protein